MDLKQIAELASGGFELVGVALLVLGAVIALIRYGSILVRRGSPSVAYSGLRKNLGSAILLGLEFLVAADIIRTVAVEPTLQSVGVLAVIVLVRTFLSWSLEVEIEGIWPWRRAQASGGALPERQNT
jgi:uncharacterized membrane protein